MFLLLNKKSENENTVNYLIETSLYEKTPAGVVKTLVKAFCIFDKVTKKISFDSAKTDPYFLQSPWEFPMIEAHLIDIDKKQKGFPQTYSIVTGG